MLLYTRSFFELFAAAAVFMTGVALQFHFGEYVDFLGHGVDTLGRLMAVGMFGCLLIRLHIGRWIDRFGCRPVWLIGATVVAGAVAAMQYTADLSVLAVLRVLAAMAQSAVMTTIAVTAAQIAPDHRRAESIGTIGLAGFTGIIIGPLLGDWIYRDGASVAACRVFFWTTAGCSLLSGVMMALAWQGRSSQEPDSAPASVRSQISVIAGHWPGPVLWVGMIFGIVYSLQSSFLERLASARGFHEIQAFFLAYAPTAMSLRVLFRRVPERIGRGRTLIGGLLVHACGLLCMVGIQSAAGLILPGILMGIGHCFLWPSMIDLAAGRFPNAHRGTGTAVILGASDLGMLIGFGALGELIEAAGYDVAVATLAVLMFIAAGIARREAAVI